MPISPGTVVRYHGSLTDHHGVYVVEGNAYRPTRDGGRELALHLRPTDPSGCMVSFAGYGSVTVLPAILPV